jgi:hypothetical protein
VQVWILSSVELWQRHTGSAHDGETVACCRTAHRSATVRDGARATKRVKQADAAAFSSQQSCWQCRAYYAKPVFTTYLNTVAHHFRTLPSLTVQLKIRNAF